MDLQKRFDMAIDAKAEQTIEVSEYYRRAFEEVFATLLIETANQKFSFAAAKEIIDTIPQALDGYTMKTWGQTLPNRLQCAAGTFGNLYIEKAVPRYLEVYRMMEQRRDANRPAGS